MGGRNSTGSKLGEGAFRGQAEAVARKKTGATCLALTGSSSQFVCQIWRRGLQCDKKNVVLSILSLSPDTPRGDGDLGLEREKAWRLRKTAKDPAMGQGYNE